MSYAYFSVFFKSFSLSKTGNYKKNYLTPEAVLFYINGENKVLYWVKILFSKLHPILSYDFLKNLIKKKRKSGILAKYYIQIRIHKVNHSHVQIMKFKND